MTWIQTSSGAAIDLLSPDPTSITIEDVACSLAHLNRYTGHMRQYSVAQHSVLCSEQAPSLLKFEALMHDAHEFALGDVSSPLKKAMRALFHERSDKCWADPFTRLDRRMRRAVAEAFDLEPDVPDEVKEIDIRMLRTEVLQGFREDFDWDVHMSSFEPYPIRIVPWTADEAESRFLSTYHALRTARA